MSDLEKKSPQVTVERELLESVLEQFEDFYLPCTPDCPCPIHPLRAVLGRPDGPEERK